MGDGKGDGKHRPCLTDHNYSTYSVWELSVQMTASLVPEEEKHRACTPRLPYLHAQLYITPQ